VVEIVVVLLVVVGGVVVEARVNYFHHPGSKTIIRKSFVIDGIILPLNIFPRSKETRVSSLVRLSVQKFLVICIKLLLGQCAVA